MTEFKTIETQEELDQVLAGRLARQKETFEKEHADYTELKARNAELEKENGALQGTINDSKTKYEGFDQTMNDLNAKVAGYETAALKTQIALKNGIPYDLASRLVGDDEASLLADAERLAGFVGKKEPVLQPLKGTEPKDAASKDGAYKNLISNMNLEGE